MRIVDARTLDGVNPLNGAWGEPSGASFCPVSLRFIVCGRTSASAASPRARGAPADGRALRHVAPTSLRSIWYVCFQVVNGRLCERISAHAHMFEDPTARGRLHGRCDHAKFPRASQTAQHLEVPRSQRSWQSETASVVRCGLKALSCLLPFAVPTAQAVTARPV